MGTFSRCTSCFFLFYTSNTSVVSIQQKVPKKRIGDEFPMEC